MANEFQKGPQVSARESDVTEEGNVHVTGNETRDVFSGGDVSIDSSNVRDVKSNGEVVLRQGSARSLDAAEASVHQGAVAQLKSDRAELSQSAVALAQVKALSLDGGSQAGFVLATGDTHMQEAGAGTLISRGEVDMEQSGALVMLTPRVTMRRSGVVFLLAQHVEGDVFPIFGPAASAVFGAVAGLVFGLVWLLGRSRGKKKGSP